MIYDIYVLTGDEDPVDALRAGPRRGELIIRRRFVNSLDTSLLALLLDQATGQEMLPPLASARLVAMDPKGMVIQGVQTIYQRDTQKAKGHRFSQRWVCKMPGAAAVLNTEKLLQRSAARLRSSAVSGFDPKDD